MIDPAIFIIFAEEQDYGGLKLTRAPQKIKLPRFCNHTVAHRGYTPGSPISPSKNNNNDNNNNNNNNDNDTTTTRRIKTIKATPNTNTRTTTIWTDNKY